MDSVVMIVALIASSLDCVFGQGFNPMFSQAGQYPGMYPGGFGGFRPQMGLQYPGMANMFPGSMGGYVPVRPMGAFSSQSGGSSHYNQAMGMGGLNSNSAASSFNNEAIGGMGGLSQGAGGSSSSSNVLGPGFMSSNNQFNNYQYGQQANSLYNSMNSYYMNSAMASQRSSGPLTKLFNSISTQFTHIAGLVGEACLKRILCESAANPQSNGKFTENVEAFITSFHEDLPDELLHLVEGFETGKKQSDANCLKKYSKCHLDSSALLEVVRGINLL